MTNKCRVNDNDIYSFLISHSEPYWLVFSKSFILFFQTKNISRYRHTRYTLIAPLLHTTYTFPCCLIQILPRLTVCDIFIIFTDFRVHRESVLNSNQRNQGITMVISFKTYIKKYECYRKTNVSCYMSRCWALNGDFTGFCPFKWNS